MSRHEGVSCDSCLRNNFKGRRYKCLICYDYDLCGNCFETGAASARHLSSHAMQCMLPRAEYDLYYQGESGSLSSEAPLSLTCPYCAKMGLTESTLYDHVCGEHTDVAIEVVCPICASQPGGEPNNVVLDFVAHIQREHRTTQEDPHLQSHERQQSRRMPQRGASNGGGIGRGASRRMPFGTMPLSPREPTIDSITEILSQLSAAGRRTQNGHNSTSAQQTIQQLQRQLDMQHPPQVSRQQIDKVPRRGPSAGSGLEPAISSSTSAAPGEAETGTTSNSQYLLARYLNDGQRTSTTRQMGPDRAQFVENLLLNTLLPNASLWRVRASQTAQHADRRDGGDVGANQLGPSKQNSFVPN